MKEGNVYFTKALAEQCAQEKKNFKKFCMSDRHHVYIFNLLKENVCLPN